MNTMLSALFPVESGLFGSSRARPLSRSAQAVGVAELTALALCGIAAAVAVALPDFIRKQPGHAIIRAVLPILCGLSLVPRRGAGTFMSLCGLGTTALMLPLNVGRSGFGNVTAMLALGPALDVAVLHARGGWMLYLRCLVAGVAANLLAWVVRLYMPSRNPQSGGTDIRSKWMSYILWGAAAGLVGAVLWFRMKHRDSDGAAGVSSDSSVQNDRTSTVEPSR